MLFLFAFFSLVNGILYVDAASEGVSSESAGIYTQKLRLNFTATLLNVYQVAWTYALQSSAAEYGLHLRVQLDDIDTLSAIVWQPLPDNTLGWNEKSSWIILRGLSVGVHTVDMDFMSSAAGQTVSVKGARLYVEEKL